MDRVKQIEQSIIKKYRKQIWRKFVKGVQVYDMIQPGDNIAVCISGGKDSMLLAKLLQELKRHGKFDFGLVFLSMDPGYNEKNRKKIEENAQILGIDVQFFESDIFNVVHNIEKSPCYLCARMRRGFLYAKAKELGCNKIALGHHFDDVIETILMGMFYGSQIQTMMPKLHSKNFEGMELIRPMYLIEEKDIAAFAKTKPVLHNPCPADKTTQRQYIKDLLTNVKKDIPFVKKRIHGAITNPQRYNLFKEENKED